MPTVMNQHHRTQPFLSPRTLTQKVCIGMGIMFLLIGFAGMIIPNLLGMHLSFFHDFIHLSSGALALWCGYADSPRKAFHFAVGFGIFYSALGLSGFIFGNPGYPGVGHMGADENILRILPNVLEFGTADHLVHILIGFIFIITAYWTSRKQTSISSKKITSSFKENRNLDPLNSESNLKDAPLGRSDINRSSDVHRRSEFEGRL